MPSRTMWLRAAAIAAVAAQVAGQQCYYPNGSNAPSSEKPCSSGEGGSACCPDKWECLDNGLCHYPADNLYGRYSCTDKDWKSPGCASNMCFYGGDTPGGESITQCSNHNDEWCCNADAQNVNCCQESPSPRPFFALASGSAYATIGARQASSAPNIASITGLATSGGSGGGSSATQTSAGSSATSAGSRQPSSATADAVSSASPITSVGTTISSGSAGVATIYVTNVITPTASTTGSGAGSSNDNGSSSSGGNSNLGVIIGCAVGIPLALALAGIVFWLCRKRRNQKANPYKETPELGGDSPDSVGFAGGAAAKLGKNQKSRHSRPGTAEIDGNPVGVGRPVSTVKGHAELAAGQGFQPGQGTPYAPDTVGLGGGSGNERNTWGSVPPQYSPGQNQAAFANTHPNAMELDSTSVMPVINEKSEAPQQYQAYKPPNPVAELPTIKTPPEDLEKQLHR